MPVNPSEVPIEYKGYLHKHGRIFRVSSNPIRCYQFTCCLPCVLQGWKTRYFELQGTHLYYYKDGTVSHSLKMIQQLIDFSVEDKMPWRN